MGNLFSSCLKSSSTSNQKNTEVPKIRSTYGESLVLPKTEVSITYNQAFNVHTNTQKHDRTAISSFTTSVRKFPAINPYDRTATWLDETVPPKQILAPKIYKHDRTAISPFTTSVREYPPINLYDRTATRVDETVLPKRILAPKIYETSEISGYLSDKYGRRPW